jgi:subtilisin-like proprotein convertase family protein
MKKQLGCMLCACLATLSARAVISSTSVENINAAIPDGDLNGISSQLLAGLPGTITDVNVTLTIAGGFNGDFYGYLLHNNTSAILLNRAGRTSSSSLGYPDAGFGPDNSSVRFTFDDQAAHDVHLYRTFAFSLNGNSQLTGSWQPDGRAIDPLSAGSAFDAAARPSTLGVFNGMDPNGAWTLYLADVSPGGEGTLVNWGLSITAVPEPGSAALILLGTFIWMAARRGAQRV